MARKLGKNFSSDTFAKSGDLYPAKKLLVDNLNKMIEHTGKYTWSAYGNQHITKNAKQLNLEKGSSLELDLSRKGIYVSIQGTFKGIFYSGTDWAVITLEDMIPDMFNPIAQIATSINTTESGGSMVFILNGNLYIAAPSVKTKLATINISMTFPAGPTLVLKTSKRPKLAMSDHISTNVINAIWSDFSKSSAKMPTRPGARGVSTKEKTIDARDGILGGTISVNKSQLGSSLTGLIKLTPAKNISDDTFSIDTYWDESYLPKTSQPIAANITQVWTDSDNKKQTKEWLIDGATINPFRGNITVPIPKSFKDANTNDKASVNLAFNGYW